MSQNYLGGIPGFLPRVQTPGAAAAAAASAAARPRRVMIVNEEVDADSDGEAAGLDEVFDGAVHDAESLGDGLEEEEREDALDDEGDTCEAAAVLDVRAFTGDVEGEVLDEVDRVLDDDVEGKVDEPVARDFLPGVDDAAEGDLRGLDLA